MLDNLQKGEPKQGPALPSSNFSFPDFVDKNNRFAFFYDRPERVWKWQIDWGLLEDKVNYKEFLQIQPFLQASGFATRKDMIAYLQDVLADKPQLAPSSKCKLGSTNAYFLKGTALYLRRQDAFHDKRKFWEVLYVTPKGRGVKSDFKTRREALQYAFENKVLQWDDCSEPDLF